MMQLPVSVSRSTDDQLRFQWANEHLKKPVSIYWSPSANGAMGNGQLLARVDDGNQVSMADPSPGQRSYYLVAPAEGQPFVVAERQLLLDGQVNFRDLGGYASSDGRRVRWGQLFRSGDLSRLSDRDLSYLGHLDLKLVCDLRVDFEVNRAPDRLPEEAARLSLPVRGGETPENELYAAVDRGDLGGLDNDFLLHSNRMFVRDFTSAYGTMVRNVMDAGNRPAVVHCTAGKDRAGLGAAIILLILGVPIETVFEDYLLTNRYRAEWTKEMLARIRQQIVDRHGLSAETIDLSPVEALFVAKREYLSAALETIDQEYGSFEAYMRDGLGLSLEMLTEFQDNMLL
jgi:protein-tyrosine phosphatase